MLELERPSDYASNLDQTYTEFDVPEVIIGLPEAADPNEVATETEQAIIAITQDEGEFQDGGQESHSAEAELFQRALGAEPPDENNPVTADLDPPDEPPLPPVLQGFPEGEDDAEEGGGKETHGTEAAEPRSNEPGENEEVTAVDREGTQDMVAEVPDTDIVKDVSEPAKESSANPGIVRKLMLLESQAIWTWLPQW